MRLCAFVLLLLIAVLWESVSTSAAANNNAADASVIASKGGKGSPVGSRAVGKGTPATGSQKEKDSKNVDNSSQKIEQSKNGKENELRARVVAQPIDQRSSSSGIKSSASAVPAKQSDINKQKFTALKSKLTKQTNSQRTEQPSKHSTSIEQSNAINVARPVQSEKPLENKKHKQSKVEVSNSERDRKINSRGTIEALTVSFQDEDDSDVTAEGSDTVRNSSSKDDYEESDDGEYDVKDDDKEEENDEVDEDEDEDQNEDQDQDQDQDENENESEDEDDQEGEDEEEGSTAPIAVIPEGKSNRNLLSTISRVAVASGKLCRAAIKSSFDLVAVKHVTADQIRGKWKLEQHITFPNEMELSLPAVIDMYNERQISLTCNGKEFRSEYEFEERSWPRRCTLEFHSTVFPPAPANSKQSKMQPLQLQYRGHFKRSMLNPGIVLLRGKIYRTEGRLFWKRQVLCGHFRGSKKRYQ